MLTLEKLRRDGVLTLLVLRCSGLPAMVRCVGTMCRAKNAATVLRFLETHRLEHRPVKDDLDEAEGYDYENPMLAIEGLLIFLAEKHPEAERRCSMLGIFPEDAQVTLDVAASLWGASEADTSGRRLK